jgi:Zn-dependent protease with chaperone function
MQQGDNILAFEISKIRHPKEKFYGNLMLVIGTLIWFSLVFFALYENTKYLFEGAVCVGIFWFISFVSRALVRAYMIGHYVMVSEKQFPHLHKMIKEGAEALGLPKPPTTFVYNSNGVMNAFALKLVGRTRYIWLTSQLIDANNDEQVKFVIGHELGHHIAGHLNRILCLLRLPAYQIPFLSQAYSRSRELTCDRIGFVVSRNLQASLCALQMLASGSAKLNAEMNPTAFRAQEEIVPRIAGFFLNILSTYPRLTQRVDAVSRFTQFASASSSTSRAYESTLKAETQMV